jgi:hypothetical protein
MSILYHLVEVKLLFSGFLVELERDLLFDLLLVCIISLHGFPAPRQVYLLVNGTINEAGE